MWKLNKTLYSLNNGSTDNWKHNGLLKFKFINKDN